MQLLAGDIGGTRTRLQLGRWESNRLQFSEAVIYHSAAYVDLVPIVREFLSNSASGDIDAACFAVAGPVFNGEAKITNLPWALSESRLSTELGIARLRLVNDFEGAAWGVGTLSDNEVVELQRGEPPPSGLMSQVLVGAGTGFGQAIILTDGNHKTVLATEGGHVDFAPRDEEELALWQYLQQTLPRISYETLLSGQGLVRLFSFYCHYLDQQPGEALLQAMAEGDKARAISQFALSGEDPIAGRALRRFVSIYGAQAGNVALATKATGGVYIGGGIAPKILDALRQGEFMAAFLAKAPMVELLRRIPVRVIKNTAIGLSGAMVLAARLGEGA
jgi:glucokinase